MENTMTKLLMAFVILGSLNSYASEEWKNRLYCYGTFLSNSEFKVELKDSINQEGTSREVYFQEGSNGESKLVTSDCELEGKTLICKNKNVTVKVNTAEILYQGGLWDAAGYRYYKAEVSRKNFWGTKTESIRCR
jgi:hypothetical protein